MNMNMRPDIIYLDHAASTPLDPRVLKAMLPYLTEEYGNPSSLHTMGQNARKAVDKARRQIADILRVTPKEVIFTGSGTESDNLAILGIAEAYAKHGKHIITSSIEHEAVLECMRFLEKNRGFTITQVPVDRSGMVDLEAVEKALKSETVLVSIMAANNEIGTIEPLETISALIQKMKNQHDRSAEAPPFFHTDACQAAGGLELNVGGWGVDLLTLNGSKIYGPKGVGALYVRKGIRVAPQLHGGTQEFKQRAGTHNVPAIVGFGEALSLVEAERLTENKRLTELRDHFIQRVVTELPDVQLNGHSVKRLPNNVHFTAKGIEGEPLLLRLDMEGICASAGSACTEGSTEPSHVLLAIGVSKKDAYGSIRFSMGKSTTQPEIDHVIERFVAIVNDLRAESGRY